MVKEAAQDIVQWKNSFQNVTNLDQLFFVKQ